MDRIVVTLSLVLFTTLSWARVPLSDQEVADIVNQFQYMGNYTEIYSDKDGGSWDSCWVYTKTIETNHPKSADPLAVDLMMYIPNRNDLGSKTIPAVIMLPPTGGVNILDKKMAKSFCKADTSAIIIKNDFANITSQAKGHLQDPTDHELSYHRATAAVKAVMKMIEDDVNLDQERMGLFGVSLGGILGAFAMSTQEDIAAGYLIVSGGDVPYILAHSEQDEVSRIRRQRMNEQGLSSREEYEEFLRFHITIDPIDLARNMLPETLHMVISEKDDNVPTSNQLALHKAYGEPEATYSGAGHVGTVINSLFFAGDRKRVLSFFEGRFAQVNPRPAAFDWMHQLSVWASL